MFCFSFCVITNKKNPHAPFCSVKIVARYWRCWGNAVSLSYGLSRRAKKVANDELENRSIIYLFIKKKTTNAKTKKKQFPLPISRLRELRVTREAACRLSDPRLNRRHGAMVLSAQKKFYIHTLQFDLRCKCKSQVFFFLI